MQAYSGDLELIPGLFGAVLAAAKGPIGIFLIFSVFMVVAFFVFKKRVKT